jgi:probable F420-dependent oxidoreductase
MKCSLLLHTQRVDRAEEFVTSRAIQETARAAEAAGFDAVSVTDHPFPDDEWMNAGGHHALDPFVALSFVAAATTRLRLLTYIYVLPYRNPFLSAKSVASLDAVSGGRLILGAAAGYLEPEFRALGVPFEERNDLADEAIRAMKVAWSGSGVRFEGRHFRAEGHTALPRPIQQPHPPIWIGGNSKQAIRRAVELADGWLPIYTPARFAARRRTPALESPADLAKRMTYARELCRETRRTAPFEVVITATGLRDFGKETFDLGAFVAGVAEWREAGATYMNVNLAAETRAEHLTKIERFGADVLPRI